MKIILDLKKLILMSLSLVSAALTMAIESRGDESVSAQLMNLPSPPSTGLHHPSKSTNREEFYKREARAVLKTSDSVANRELKQRLLGFMPETLSVAYLRNTSVFRDEVKAIDTLLEAMCKPHQNPAVGQGLDSCILKEIFYKFACYQAFLIKDFETQEKACGLYERSAHKLSLYLEHEPSYRHDEVQGRLFSLDAKANQIALSNSNTRSEDLDALSSRFPKPTDIKEFTSFVTRYEAWVGFGRYLYLRARVEEDAGAQIYFLQRAVICWVTANNMLGEPKNEVYFFPFSDGRDVGLSLRLLAHLRIKLNTELKPGHFPQDEFFVQLRRQEQKEQKQFDKELEAILVQAFNGNSLPELKELESSDRFERALNENSGPQDLVDPLLALIQEVKVLIKSLQAKTRERLVQEPKSDDEWLQSNDATAVLSILKMAVLPTLADFNFKQLSSLKNAILQGAATPAELLNITYKKKEYLNLPTVSGSPEPSSIVAAQLFQKNHIDDGEIKKLLMDWIYKRWIEEPPQKDLTYFHTFANGVLKQLYSYPLPSEFVQKNTSKTDSMDDVYRKWILSIVEQFEFSQLDLLRGSKEVFDQVAVDLILRSFFLFERHRQGLEIHSLERWVPQPPETLLGLLKRIHETFPKELSKELFQTENADPIVQFSALELRKEILGEPSNEYLPVLEKRVLVPSLIGKLDDKIQARLNSAILGLGYTDLPLEFVLSNLSPNGTRLEKLAYLYLSRAIDQAVTERLGTEQKEFSARQKQELLKMFNERWIPEFVRTHEWRELKPLWVLIRQPDLPLDRILHVLDTNKDWRREPVDLNPPVQFEWNRTLRLARQMPPPIYRQSQERLLVKKNIDLFKDESFKVYLSNELAIMGFSELDVSYVRFRLTQDPANFEKLLEDFLKLTEKKEAHYTNSRKAESSDTASKSWFSFLPSFSLGFGGSGEGDREDGPLLFYRSKEKVKYFADQRFKRSDGEYVFEIQKFMSTEDFFHLRKSALSQDEMDVEIIPSLKTRAMANPFIPSGGLIDPEDDLISKDITHIPSFFTYASGVGSGYSYHVRMPEAPFRLESRVSEETDLGPYRSYYSEEDLWVDLGPETEAFVIELRKLYPKLIQAAKQKDDLEKVKSQWKQVLLEALTENLAVKIEPSKIVEELSSELDPDTEILPDLWIAAALEGWLKFSFTHPGVASFLKEDSFHIAQGKSESKKLSAVAEAGVANCFESNSLYGYILRKYFKIPSRLVTGVAGWNGQTNANHVFSKELPEDTRVIDVRENGHAWSEILLGRSWVTRDATPYGEMLAKKLTGSMPVRTTFPTASVRKRKLKKTEIVNFIHQIGTRSGYSAQEFFSGLDGINPSLIDYYGVLEEEKQTHFLPLRELIYFSLWLPRGLPVEFQERKVPSSWRTVEIESGVPSLPSDPSLQPWYRTSPDFGEHLKNVLPPQQLSSIRSFNGLSVIQLVERLNKTYGNIEEDLNEIYRNGFALNEAVLALLAEELNNEIKNRDSLIIVLFDDHYLVVSFLKYYLQKYGRSGFPQNLPTDRILELTLSKDELASELIQVFGQDVERYLENSTLGFSDTFSVIEKLDQKANSELGSIFRKWQVIALDAVERQIQDLVKIASPIDQLKILGPAKLLKYKSISESKLFPHVVRAYVDEEFKDLADLSWTAEKTIRGANPTLRARLDAKIHSKVAEIEKGAFDPKVKQALKSGLFEKVFKDHSLAYAGLRDDLENKQLLVAEEVVFEKAGRQQISPRQVVRSVNPSLGFEANLEKFVQEGKTWKSDLASVGYSALAQGFETGDFSKIQQVPKLMNLSVQSLGKMSFADWVQGLEARQAVFKFLITNKVVAERVRQTEIYREFSSVYPGRNLSFIRELKEGNLDSLQSGFSQPDVRIRVQRYYAAEAILDLLILTAHEASEGIKRQPEAVVQSNTSATPVDDIQRLESEWSKKISDVLSQALTSTNFAVKIADKNRKFVLQDPVETAGEPVSSFKSPDALFDVIGGYQRLRRWQIRSSQSRSQEECLAFAPFLLEMDQILNRGEPDQLKVLLKRTVEALPAGVFAGTKWYQSSKESITWDLHGLLLDSGSNPLAWTKNQALQVLESKTDGEWQKKYHLLFDEVVEQFSKSCLGKVAHFYQNSQSASYIKNWVHLQTLIADHDFKEGRATPVSYLAQTAQQSKLARRADQEERSVIPRLLDVAAAAVPHYAETDSRGTQVYLQNLLPVLFKSDLTQAEIMAEVKRYALSVMLKVTKKNQESIFKILDALWADLPLQDRIALCLWLDRSWTTLIQKANGDAKKKESIELFHVYALARIPIGENEKFKELRIENRFKEVFDHLRKHINETDADDFIVSTLIKAGTTALHFKETNLRRDFLELIFKIEKVDAVSPDTKSELAKYFSISHKYWDQSQIYVKELLKLTKYSGTDETEYEENSRKAANLLRVMGGPSVKFHSDHY